MGAGWVVCWTWEGSVGAGGIVFWAWEGSVGAHVVIMSELVLVLVS